MYTCEIITKLLNKIFLPASIDKENLNVYNQIIEVYIKKYTYNNLASRNEYLAKTSNKNKTKSIITDKL